MPELMMDMVLVKTRIRDRVEEFNADPPDDDTIWRRRTWSAERWVGRTGVPFEVVLRHLVDRGFCLEHGVAGPLAAAPCRGCGAEFPVELLSSLRLCDECGAGTPETICRQERQGREPLEHLRRTYSPGVKRRPVALRTSVLQVADQ